MQTRLPSAENGEPNDVIKICVRKKCNAMRRAQLCWFFVLTTGLSVTLLMYRTRLQFWSRFNLASFRDTLNTLTLETSDSELTLSSEIQRVADIKTLSSSSHHFTTTTKQTRAAQTSGREKLEMPTRSSTNRTVTASDDPKWLPLNRSSNETYVYAAYFDDVEDSSYVRLLVVNNGGKINVSVKCLYFSQAGGYDQPLAMTEGRLVSYYPWRNSTFYTGAFAKCPLPIDLSHPQAVSIVSTSCDDINTCNSDVSSVLHVHYGFTETAGKPRWNVSRCFPALFGYGNVMELIQQVEISQVLGVEHFLFYNLSASLEVNRVLHYYKQRGVAEVVNWQYPPPMRRSIYYHQDGAIQDCVHRNLHSTRYLLLGDLDEIILPRNATSVLTLLEDLHAHRPQCASLLFVNTFFPLKGALSEEERERQAEKFPDYDFALQHRLNMLLVQHRVNELWTNGRRAKPALIPGRIEAGDVHNTKAHRPVDKNYTSCQVPVDLAIMHHYRHSVPGALGNYIKKHGIVPDRDLLRFAPEIVQRIRRAMDDLKDQVQFTPNKHRQKKSLK